MRSYRTLRPLFAALLLAGAALGGCSGSLRYATQGTSVFPEAKAIIVADVDRVASTTHINLKVDRLPSPTAFGGTNFVAWAKPTHEQRWLRLGPLNYDPALFKGELFDASIERTSFDLVISVESDFYAEAPSPLVIIDQPIPD